MSATELVALVCCDLGAIVRGRSLPASDLDAHLAAGVGWVPANHSLTPLGPLAEPNPFGSTGDLRLLPDVETRARVEAGRATPRWSSCCATSWRSTARRGSAVRGSFLRDALAELRRELGVSLAASFEHEFQLLERASLRRSRSRWRSCAGPSRSPVRSWERSRRPACSPSASSPSSPPTSSRSPFDPADGRRGGGSRRRAQGGRARARPPARSARDVHAAAEPGGSGQRRAHPSQSARCIRALRAV